jgi:hypothetical protein
LIRNRAIPFTPGGVIHDATSALNAQAAVAS